MKRIFMWLTVSIFLFAGLNGRAQAADIEAVLDSSDGSSAFVTKDSTSAIQALIDSDGNMVIKGGLRLDSSGTKYTTAENLIVDGKIGIGNTNPSPLLQIGDSGVTLGTFGLAGSTSGLVTIQPAAAAGTWTLTLPADDGDDGQFLRTNGAGVTSWAASVGGGGDVTGPSSSVDNEIALFSGTTGKLIKRATTSGIVKATSGVISAAAAGTDYVAPNAAITGATNTKITYDAKGLVTAGASAVLASADFANQGTTTTLLHGNAAGNPSFGAVVEGDITLADVATGDVSITKHGFAPKAPNDTTKFLRGDATWNVPLGYAINVQALTSSPVDSQTVYFGMLPKAPTTTANISKVYIRKAGTIKIAEIYCYSGTAGSNEAWSLYVRKNNTTDTLIATLSVNTNERVFSNTGLNIAVAVGDYIEIKGIQPAWVTNPLTTIYGGYIYIE